MKSLSLLRDASDQRERVILTERQLADQPSVGARRGPTADVLSSIVGFDAERLPLGAEGQRSRAVPPLLLFLSRCWSELFTGANNQSIVCDARGCGWVARHHRQALLGSRLSLVRIVGAHTFAVAAAEEKRDEVRFSFQTLLPPARGRWRQVALHRNLREHHQHADHFLRSPCFFYWYGSPGRLNDQPVGRETGVGSIRKIQPCIAIFVSALDQERLDLCQGRSVAKFVREDTVALLWARGPRKPIEGFLSHRDSSSRTTAGPTASVGGVGVVGLQKAKALARMGIRVVVVMPYYACVRREELNIQDAGIELDFPMDYGPQTGRRTTAKVFEIADREDGCHVYLIHAPCFDKQGVYTYTPEEAEHRGDQRLAGQGHQDFFEVNVTLQKATLELAMRLQSRPDVVECHDAHTAFIPAMMQTIPRYEGYFRDVANGVDPEDFRPTDAASMQLAAAYDPAAGDFTGKHTCRTELIREIAENTTPNVRFVGHLSDSPGRPLIATVSRLSQQRGSTVLSTESVGCCAVPTPVTHLS